ncbi:unnamed protein product [Nezara viridula]|uniref:Uncharacterized protein n=1 Tax=Nezara viridula TaxID=85310 RepID=A0A9P0GYJ8_NEZVI|nr:unnamed protein product [Nezara viridula]
MRQCQQHIICQIRRGTYFQIVNWISNLQVAEWTTKSARRYLMKIYNQQGSRLKVKMNTRSTTLMKTQTGIQIPKRKAGKKFGHLISCEAG